MDDNRRENAKEKKRRDCGEEKYVAGREKMNKIRLDTTVNLISDAFCVKLEMFFHLLNSLYDFFFFLNVAILLLITIFCTFVVKMPWAIPT